MMNYQKIVNGKQHFMQYDKKFLLIELIIV